jgi:hypothetical protein
MDSLSLQWIQTIGNLHIPVSLAPIKHSLMLTGTKGTFNTVTVEMCLLLSASRRQSSGQQLATSLTHVKITYYNFFTTIHCMLCCKLNEFYEFVFQC